MNFSLRNKCVCGVTVVENRTVFVKAFWGPNSTAREVQLSQCQYEICPYTSVQIYDEFIFNPNELDMCIERYGKLVGKLAQIAIEKLDQDIHECIHIVFSEFIKKSVSLHHVGKIDSIYHPSILFQLLMSFRAFSLSGYVHCDAHWGNILLEPLPEYEEMDFGRKRCRQSLMTRWKVRIIDSEFAVKFPTFKNRDEISNPIVQDTYNPMFESIIFSSGHEFRPHLEWARFLYNVVKSGQFKSLLPNEHIEWTESMIRAKEYDDYGVLLKYGCAVAQKIRKRNGFVPSDPPSIDSAITHVVEIMNLACNETV